MSSKTHEFIVILLSSALTIYLSFSFIAASLHPVSGWDGFGRSLAVMFWAALSLIVMGYRGWFK